MVLLPMYRLISDLPMVNNNRSRRHRSSRHAVRSACPVYRSRRTTTRSRRALGRPTRSGWRSSRRLARGSRRATHSLLTPEGHGCPAAGGLADHDCAVGGDEGLAAHIVHGGLDVRRALQAGAEIVWRAARTIVLRPGAAGFTVAAALRQDDDVAACDEP